MAGPTPDGSLRDSVALRNATSPNGVVPRSEERLIGEARRESRGFLFLLVALVVSLALHALAGSLMLRLPMTSKLPDQPDTVPIEIVSNAEFGRYLPSRTPDAVSAPLPVAPSAEGPERPAEATALAAAVQPPMPMAAATDRDPARDSVAPAPLAAQTSPQPAAMAETPERVAGPDPADLQEAIAAQPLATSQAGVSQSAPQSQPEAASAVSDDVAVAPIAVTPPRMEEAAPDDAAEPGELSAPDLASLAVTTVTAPIEPPAPDGPAPTDARTAPAVSADRIDAAPMTLNEPRASVSDPQPARPIAVTAERAGDAGPPSAPAPADSAPVMLSQVQADSTAARPQPSQRPGASPPAAVSPTPGSPAATPRPNSPDRVIGDRPPPLVPSAPEPAPRPVEPPDAALAALPQTTPGNELFVQRHLLEITDTIGCARLNARYQSESGSVRIAGHVPSNAVRGDLVARIMDVPGVSGVEESALHIVGEPYCQVLTFLQRPEIARSGEHRLDLGTVGEAVQASVARYTGGELLDLRVGTPPFESYIYVSYFSADGSVTHLVPQPELVGIRFNPDADFLIGGEEGLGPQVWIGPPYGLDMVLAIASSSQLFDEPRPQSENASEYLRDLEAAIERNSSQSTHIEYAYHLIYTNEE